ncbi:MAG: stage II sporulation protein R [Thermoanaerobacterales bacterium]|nr:stage II sporulation protein R [Thermoanaerobacterales bacterium]
MRCPRVVACTVAAALILTGAAFWHWAGQAVRAYNPENLIRFHVIASSDTEEDQELKLKVRDAVVGEMAPRLKGVQDVTEARERVRENLDRIQEVAARTVKASGKDYPVRVYYGHFDFPEKEYGSLKVPAGNYEAVRVVIGDGQGRNWWCILFPPLCFVSAKEDAVPAAASPLPPVEIRWRLKVVELWEQYVKL